MILRCSAGVLAAAIAATPAVAAPADNPARIVVIGHGSSTTDPDVANISFSIRGEGATSDAAAAALVKKRAAIADGLAMLLGNEVAVNTGDLSILEARDKACDLDEETRLSSGACAVRGYVANIEASLRLSPVKDAGTALGLAARLGASDAQLGDFGLRDPADARGRAMAAAIADARSRALAIVAASGSKLGKLISVEDQEARGRDAADIIVTARRRTEAMPIPPIVIDLKAAPIETTVGVTVTYALEQ